MKKRMQRIQKGDRQKASEPMQMVALDAGFYRGRRIRPGAKFVLLRGDTIGSWMVPVGSPLVEEHAARAKAVPHTGGRKPKTIAEALDAAEAEARKG